MCCEKSCDRIDIIQVVDRLRRIAAVNDVVANKIKNVGMSPLSLSLRHAAQAMIFKKMLDYDKEDEANNDSGDAEDIYDVPVRHTQILQKTINTGIAMEYQARNAVRELLQGDKEDILGTLRQFDPQSMTAVNPPYTTPARLPQTVLYDWMIAPDDVAERSWNSYIGKGVSAEVHHGLWLGAPVAIKEMYGVSPADDQKFREEATIWYSLRHPNIVTLFGACSRGYQVFVCDLVDGKRLDKCDPKHTSSRHMWGYLHDAAMGLQGLHFHGVVHGDLKCDNILVSCDGRAKLIDFGLSCQHFCDGGNPRGAFKSKAPECIRGAGPTYESDVYSFGMCIVQALTGEQPWGNFLPDGNVKDLVANGKLPEQQAEFSSKQWELVKRMCCLDPSARLPLDDVVLVLGLFAARAPYTDMNLGNKFLWMIEQ